VVPLLDRDASVIGSWEPAAGGLAGLVDWTLEGRAVVMDAAGAEICEETGSGARCPLPVRLPFGWIGAWRSAATGLVWLRARWYSPVLAQFLSQDPDWLVDGPNLYAYAANDPLNRSDPLGLASTGPAGGRAGPGNDLPPGAQPSDTTAQATWQEQLFDLPWAAAFGIVLSGRAPSTTEARAQAVSDVVVRAGATPETARVLASKYLESAGQFGMFLGGVLGMSAGRPLAKGIVNRLVPKVPGVGPPTGPAGTTGSPTGPGSGPGGAGGGVGPGPGGPGGGGPAGGSGAADGKPGPGGGTPAGAGGGAPAGRGAPGGGGAAPSGGAGGQSGGAPAGAPPVAPLSGPGAAAPPSGAASTDPVYWHSLTRGGLDDIVANQRLLMSDASVFGGGAPRVNAHTGLYTGQLAGSTIVEFTTPVPPSGAPHQPTWGPNVPAAEWWWGPYYLPIRVLRVIYPDGRVFVFPGGGGP
jgi:RHS repeat-associated protein